MANVSCGLDTRLFQTQTVNYAGAENYIIHHVNMVRIIIVFGIVFAAKFELQCSINVQ